MVKVPLWPEAWNDQSAGAPPAAPRFPPDLNNRSGGILDRRPPSDWSLAGSGLSILLHPETIADIDFGNEPKTRPGQGNMAGQAAGFMLAQAAPVPSAQNRSVAGPADAAPPRSALGGLSATYESRGNPGTVSSGRNDPGGRSYGTYQFATNTGDAAAFVASPEFGPWAREFENLAPATDAFGNQWQAVAARGPDAFQQAQHTYIRRTHYDPVVSQINRSTGYDLDGASDAVRDAAWSASVQHRAAGAILADALRRTDQALPRTDPNYEDRLIDNIYDRRTEYVTELRDRAMADNRVGHVQQFNSVINNRYPQERADAQNMLRNQRHR